ncbi:MAG: hypothetical protein WC465_03135 [Patescibacteria group bacterium]
MLNKDTIQKELDNIINNKEELDFEINPIIRSILNDNLQIIDIHKNKISSMIYWKIKLNYNGTIINLKGFTNNKKTDRELAISIFKKILNHLDKN